MTCLINARAYRDGSAAAPRWPDTSYWVLLGLSWACTRAPRASLYRARGFRDGAPRVRVCRGHRSSQRLREFLQSIHFSCAPPGPGVGPGVGGPGWVRGWVLAGAFGIQLAVASRKPKPALCGIQPHGEQLICNNSSAVLSYLSLATASS